MGRDRCWIWLVLVKMLEAQGKIAIQGAISYQNGLQMFRDGEKYRDWRQWYSQKGPLDRFAEGLHSWAADVSKGPREFGEYIGNNRGAGLATCFAGAIIGPALSLGLGEAIATPGIWAPAVFGGSKTAVAANTTVGAINTASYLATTDDPVWAGAGLSFLQGYGMSRIGAVIGSAESMPAVAKYAAGGGAGFFTDFVFQSAKINMGMQTDYSASQLAGSTLFGGLSALPYQSFKPVGQIGADFWPHYYPAVNTAKYTTSLTGWMSWVEDDYRKNKNRNR